MKLSRVESSSRDRAITRVSLSVNLDPANADKREEKRRHVVLGCDSVPIAISAGKNAREDILSGEECNKITLIVSSAVKIITELRGRCFLIVSATTANPYCDVSREKERERERVCDKLDLSAQSDIRALRAQPSLHREIDSKVHFADLPGT